jgi:4-amino-4-deoxy-L-arabinose transferase
MENQILGITTIGLCLIVYYYSFKSYQLKKFDRTILLILFGGLILRVFISTDMYLHHWDERYHALVAKNLMEHPFKPMLYDLPLLDFDFRDWSKNHIWVHKQPIPLWTMAASLKIFGVNVIALRLPSILLSLAAVYCTYGIGKILFTRKVGFIAGFLSSIHGLILELTSGRIATDHIDVFFLSLITISIYFGLKFATSKKIIFNLLCGIFMSLAILSKWLPAMIILPIWILGILQFKKFTWKEISFHFFVLMILNIALVLPWQFYIYHQFPLEAQWESSFNFKHLTEALQGHAKPLFYHFNKMRMIFGEIIYLPLLWILYKAFTKKRAYKYYLLLIWILIPYLFFTLAKTKMQGYIIFTAPAFFILTGIFLSALPILLSRLNASYLKTIFIIALIGLPIRYSIERLKPFQQKSRHQAWIASLEEIENKKESKQVIFNTKYPIEIMFYSDIIAYEALPGISKLKEIYNQGFEIIIDQNQNLTAEIKELDFIEIVNLRAEQ